MMPPGGPAPALDREDLDLLQQAQNLSLQTPLRPLSAAKLTEVASTHGIDFATALLYQTLTAAPANSEFARLVWQSRLVANYDPDLLVGIVPGAFYQQHRTTGADGRRAVGISRKLGLKSEVIPLKSFGSLDENADIIAAWLRSRRTQAVLLLSLSKGSSDVKEALRRTDAEVCFQNVRAWVSLSGLVQGTPLVAWLRSHRLRNFGLRLLLSLRGHRPSTLDELAWGHGSRLEQWPALPSSLKIVHVYGFPLQRHLRHPWAFRGYERLRALGPNDGGGIVLGDLGQLPGIVFPIWGADHYLSPVWDISPFLESIVAAALRFPKSRQANQSEQYPSNAPAARSHA